MKVALRAENNVGKKEILGRSRPCVADQAAGSEETTVGFTVSAEVISFEDMMDELKGESGSKGHGEDGGRTWCGSDKGFIYTKGAEESVY